MACIWEMNKFYIFLGLPTLGHTLDSKTPEKKYRKPKWFSFVNCYPWSVILIIWKGFNKKGLKGSSMLFSSFFLKM